MCNGHWYLLDNGVRVKLADYHPILMDWKGLEKDGKPFPYSKENADILLKEDKLFRGLICDILDIDYY